jgi:ribonuclease P protein component
MLSQKNRLRKKKEFAYIYKKNNCFYTKHLSLYVVPTKAPFIKVGFSVSNKVGNSVERHKIKRRLSEIVRVNLSSLPIKNYVFVARLGTKDLSFDDLKKEVNEIIEKANKKA